MPALLTVREAAAAIGDTAKQPEFTRRLIRAGVLKGYQLGPRKLRVRRDSVEAYLRSHQV